MLLSSSRDGKHWEGGLAQTLGILRELGVDLPACFPKGDPLSGDYTAGGSATDNG